MPDRTLRLSREETARILAEVRDGNIEAFGCIVEDTQMEARLCAVRLGLRGAAVDDLTQEAYLRALEVLDRFDPAGSFLAWLKGIIRNLHLQRRDRWKREVRARTGYVQDYLLRRSAHEDDRDDANDRLRALRTCMERLSAGARRVLELKFSGGMKAAEIARVVKSSIGTVTKALSRARMALRECIAGEMKRREHVS